MGRIEDFGKVIKVVTELTEVTDQDILGKSRVPEVVDARWLVIVLMRERGHSARMIAPLVNHPVRTINHALCSFDERARYAPYIRNILAIARQQLL